jgi:hypothetical protein
MEGSNCTGVETGVRPWRLCSRECGPLLAEQTLPDATFGLLLTLYRPGNLDAQRLWGHLLHFQQVLEEARARLIWAQCIGCRPEASFLFSLLNVIKNETLIP